MNPEHRQPSAEEFAKLIAYLDARERGNPPTLGELDFPSGLAGDLLRLADNIHPDPAFADRLEFRLRRAAGRSVGASRPGWLTALWQTINPTERKPAMKRLPVYALVVILLIYLVWVSIPAINPSPTQTQLVGVVTPVTTMPAPTTSTPLTPAPSTPTSLPPVAVNFTPQPIPVQPPELPPLFEVLGTGYGGMGYGNLPENLPYILETALPSAPSEVSAFYRLEKTPITLEDARQIATRWGLEAGIYIPEWMQSTPPDQTARFYMAVDGSQSLFITNEELTFNEMAISPVYAGHQYPQVNLPLPETAVQIATQFLTDHGYLSYPYQVDLSNYSYGLVNFHRLVDGLPIEAPSAWVRIDSQGQVGSASINLEEYQFVGTYPLISAQATWEMLVAGQPMDHLSISYHPAQDGNPKFWGRIYPVGQVIHLFGSPTFFFPAEAGVPPYVQMNNHLLVGDTSGLLNYLVSGQRAIHVWGTAEEIDGVLQLQFAGWEPYDEFSTYFDGTVHRTADGDFLELADGQQLSLPDVPADVPSDIPLYAEGGLADGTLEWFILQVHPADEGQLPPDFTQAQVVIEQVELVYLAPGLNLSSPEVILDPAFRMLVPVWSFFGRIVHAGDTDLVFTAYVQALPNP